MLEQADECIAGGRVNQPQRLRQDHPPETLSVGQADHLACIPLTARNRDDRAAENFRHLRGRAAGERAGDDREGVELDVRDHRQRVIGPDNVHEWRGGAEEIDEETNDGAQHRHGRIPHNRDRQCDEDADDECDGGDA